MSLNGLGLTIEKTSSRQLHGAKEVFFIKKRKRKKIEVHNYFGPVEKNVKAERVELQVLAVSLVLVLGVPLYALTIITHSMNFHVRLTPIFLNLRKAE